MSCWATVTLSTDIEATADEIVEALKRLGFENVLSGKNSVIITAGDVIFRLWEKKWTVTAGRSSTFDKARFTQELARAKIMSEVKRRGYQLTQDVTQGENLVLRIKMG